MNKYDLIKHDLTKYGFEYREEYLIKWLKRLPTTCLRIEPDLTLYFEINGTGTSLIDEISIEAEYLMCALKRDIEEMNSVIKQMKKDGVLVFEDDKWRIDH